MNKERLSATAQKQSFLSFMPFLEFDFKVCY